MTEAFKIGFIKAAQSYGCSLGEAVDILKYAVASGTFKLPTFDSPQGGAAPLIDTVKPSSLFPLSGGPSQGLAAGSMASVGSTSSLGTAGTGTSGGGMGSLGSAGLPQAQNLGYNINQTGMGGVNNSVTSAPSSSVNSLLNKPTAAIMPAAM